MVSPKTRRRIRRLRLEKAKPTYSLKRFLSGSCKLLSASCFLGFAFYFALKQQSIAELPPPQPIQHSPTWVTTLAQAAIPPIPMTRQGRQVIINGRAFTAAWGEREGRIGIADMSLMQGFGVDLLNNRDEAEQPIKWFTDSQTPLVLPTWFTEQYRYLDISNLAQKFGWTLEVTGTSLRITTPTSQVKSLRQGKQTWGDRIVVELAQPATWQILEDRGEAVITIDAPIDPALQNFRAQAGNRLTAFSVTSGSSKTILRMKMKDATRPAVEAVQNPNRLVIDLRSDWMEPKNVLWAPGLRWQQQNVQLGRDVFPVVSLEIDMREPGVSLKPILSNPTTVVGTTSLFAAAQRAKVAAAINAGFFNRNTQLPLGAIRKDNQWVSGPILNRGAIAWNEAGVSTVGRLSLNQSLVTAAGRFPVQYFNTGYVGAGISHYTSGWGPSYTSILNNELIVVVQDNLVVKQQRAPAAGKTTVAIPTDGYLLVVRADRDAGNALAVGTPVQMDMVTQPADFDQYSQIMGAGPLLVENGQVVLNAASEQFNPAFAQQAAARSVIGSTPGGNLLLVAVHNRLNGAGPTLREAAQIMLQLGALNALNLDGGSSTTLYLGGQLLDRIPSTAARVNNGIGVFIQPSGEWGVGSRE
ncbi:MAG: phosphodiester glycosidase family protein [Oculatellaceae cyanobacterium Prado106]|nr:phosphodiester glycosidase family protein [Oculatellaceae cyanobacterium Prado106]